MSTKIDSDLNRFKDIVRKRVKSDLDKFIGSDAIIGKVGNKLVKIPMKFINIPHFTFGSKNKGGTGQGDGEDGDPVDGKPGKKPGQGAGNEEGEHDFTAEFSEEELADMLIERLELPELENKGKGAVNSEKSKYNKIAPQGSEGMRHFKRTYKNALARSISEGTYDPQKPVVVPIKSDKRYKSFSTKETPDVSAVIFYMIDYSGSMGDEQRKIAKNISFWIDLLLKKAYGKIDSVYICHDTVAKEVSKEDFFGASSGGGTTISSAYKLCYQLIEEKYPFSTFNTYVFHFSDGDSGGDDAESIRLLKENILPNCNAFNFGETVSAYGSGNFSKTLEEAFPNEDKVSVARMESNSDIMKAIKKFFEKGK